MSMHLIFGETEPDKRFEIWGRGDRFTLQNARSDFLYFTLQSTLMLITIRRLVGYSSTLSIQ
jgi:hypothetical protein